MLCRTGPEIDVVVIKLARQNRTGNAIAWLNDQDAILSNKHDFEVQVCR